MKEKYYSKIVLEDGFVLDGFYLFESNKSNYCFLLNKKGCSIILDKKLVSDILSNNIKEKLKMKLLSHGMAHIKTLNIKIPKELNDDVYFIIDLTKKCNFDCFYCFRNLNDNRVISNKRLKDICTFILEYAKEKKKGGIQLQVWGGEALLALNKIEYIYNFFKASNVNLVIDVETNGSLITDTIAKKLYEMNVRVGVSIDGLRTHQDIQRKLIGGESSYQLVCRGIHNLKKYYHENISGICVVTKYNYMDLAKIINHFISDLGINKMKFNLVKDNPNANEEALGLSLEEVEKFAEKLFDTVKTYNSMGLKFEEGNIEVRYHNLVNRNPFSYCISHGCQGGTNLISIDMKGDIYPCEMMDYKKVKIASIYENKHLATFSSFEKKRQKNKKNNIYYKKKENSKCRNCPWKYYCEGGCSSRVIYSEGKMKYDEIECRFNKIIYKKIIENILNNNRGNIDG